MHVNGNEMMTELFLCQGRVPKNHNKGKNERHVGIIVQTLKNNNKASADQSSTYLPETVATE